MFGKQALHECLVANVPVHEGVAAVAFYRSEVLAVTRVGERVQRNDGANTCRERVENEIAANETGGACNQKRHP